MDLQHPTVPSQGSAATQVPLSGAAKKMLVSPQQLRRAILTGAVGSALEYYDFAIFGLASALVFSHIFFPALGAKAGLMASFGTYGAGFLARPFGGAVFWVYRRSEGA
jgi:MHS family metabolite:H+ symporter-like MFS transporter